MVLNFSDFLVENLAIKRNETKVKCNDLNIRENVKRYWNQLHLLDVNRVEDFSSLFNANENSYQKNKPIIGIDNWDTRNVLDMKDLFKNAAIQSSLNKWDVSGVENMSGMFYNANFNNSLSNWEVYNVQDFSFMFCLSNFDCKIDNWEVNKNADLSNMFKLSKMKKLPIWYLFKY